MSPRIIQMPLSGGDRKAQAKGLRQAHGLHDGLFRKPQQRRADAEQKLRETEAIVRDADRMECEAWSALMWAGGPAMPSPGEPQANPTIGMALNADYDLLEVKCNACQRVSLVPLRAVKRRPETPLWKLEPSLMCEICSTPSWRQRAHIIGLVCPKPDPEPGRVPAPKSHKS
jgi:hypothetical protein